jgi:hypothetical protein
MEKETGLAITMDSDVSVLDAILNDAVQDSFEPIPVKMEIVHQIGEMKIEGLPSQKSSKWMILSSMKARVMFCKFGNQDVNKDVENFTEKRPFCSSENGVIGKLYETEWDNINNPSKDAIVMVKEKIAQGGLICKKCPLSAFGSVSHFGRQGKGQACNDLRRLLLWKQGITLPIILTLPPTSIRKFDQYCSSLQAGEKQYNRVITEISLSKVDSASGGYSVVSFSHIADVPKEWLSVLIQPIIHDGIQKPMAKALIDIFSRREVEVADYNGNEDGEDKF